MRGFSYVITRDYGFAPNPFGEFCTLATCKPDIRSRAQLDDWIIGCTSSSYPDALIYAMQVTEKITFNQYWHDERFQYKKPIMNGSLKQMYGDNIYHQENDIWHQKNSHHSLSDGSTNKDNLQKDTSSNNVIISNNFYYFGKSYISLPENFQTEILKKGRAYKNIDETPLNEFIAYLTANYNRGISDFPILFDKFDRYDGVS